ncbi:SOS response-associated peptidase [Chelatococcus composti]|uniref:Abasic site processing protein n=1 Tax=Chelatococcus composti TaxID=1743235 RepID=A0A841KCZ3_9HYPH|nr:SOS response-associated peptidase [Chelatococcus composti]MBB6167139.1 putative SOS response-associated peptidase YedK [Chelatococcus composti]MBS7735349.1 SOS response-associated peptidase [Chelatococcus composti]GGG29564.1 DUF159 family protein [Chelatococcus composti]
MCNLYNVRSNREAILDLSRGMVDRSSWNEPSRDIYPGTLAPIVRVGADGQREMVMATWGMPTPPERIRGNYDPGVTNIRNPDFKHWRPWLGPESRCVVPFNSFAEPNPAAKVEGERTPNAWFARNAERPLMFFAGIWTAWHGVKKVRDGARDFELFGFLTCGPNNVVKPIHEKAMPVILTEAEEVETWMTAPWEIARELQRSLPDDMLVIVPPPTKID